MKITVNTDPTKIKSFEWITIPLFQQKPSQMRTAIQKIISPLTLNSHTTTKLNAFKAAPEKFLTLSTDTCEILLIGLGPQKQVSYDLIRQAYGNAIRKACSHIRSLACMLPEELTGKLHPKLLGQAIVEGMICGGYQFNQYKTKKADNQSPLDTLKKIEIFVLEKKKRAAIKAGILCGKQIADNVCLARDLANMPSNVLTPQRFTEYARDALSNHPTVKIQLFDAKKAESLGMNAFLGVAKGSVHPPYFLILNYHPYPNKPVTALIGKGVTFDSGGISIKPSKDMDQMKGDMSGAAVVFAAIKTLAELQVPQNILGLIPLVENMPSGTAQKPGDIVTAMDGTTIEITNTDAEGRLILADSICYAVQQKVTAIIDIATLTGAAKAAFGDVCSPILGSHRPFTQKFMASAKYTGEKLWELPLFPEYEEYVKSDIADIVNASPKRMAGTISAAVFLKHFTAKTPWIHIDIAGTGDVAKTSGYLAKGMTASNVRNLVHYFMH